MPGKDLNIQLINSNVMTTGMNLVLQDIVWLFRKLNEHKVNAVVQFESNMRAGATIVIDGADVEMDVCSSYQSITRPLDMLEMLCDKYEVIVWIDGHDTLYTLGVGMVIQDERPMRS
jgi:hypothetical protein